MGSQRIKTIYTYPPHTLHVPLLMPSSSTVMTTKIKSMLHALELSKATARGLENGSFALLGFSRWEDLTESCERTVTFLKSSGSTDGLEDSFSTIKAYIQQLLKMNTQTPKLLLQIDELGNYLELLALVQ